MDGGGKERAGKGRERRGEVSDTVGGIIQATRGVLPLGPPAGGRGRHPDPLAPRGRAAANLGIVKYSIV